ncbi:hypothetical protein [Aureliella helgolandensis]|uniref:Cytochrome c n=1 Tax=Aureliella helgolandensis TaxID=2527968 RepID=A0A518G2D0_9BACT|nr:hypothetical protein [Aureliella helgolandensis]QDV22777.1 Cytochrome c [Aureliella helgolandensis]
MPTIEPPATASSTSDLSMANIVTFRRFLLLVWLLLAVEWSCPNVYSQEDWDDEPPEFLPGVVASFSSADGEFTRVDRAIQFSATSRDRDARLPSDQPLTVIWEGLLQIKSPGNYQFLFQSDGPLRVQLAGRELGLAPHGVAVPQDPAQPALRDAAGEVTSTATWYASSPIELKFGMQPLRVEYQGGAGAGRLGSYWSGPGFVLEPVPTSLLWHGVEQAPQDRFALGERLSRGLRCAACHEYNDQRPLLAAPALTSLQDNLRPSWLVERLAGHPSDADRRAATAAMPQFNLHSNSAAAISAALFDASADAVAPEDVKEQLEQLKRKRKNRDPQVRTTADAELGALAFASTGCVACHPLDSTAGRLRDANEVSAIAAGAQDLDVHPKLREMFGGGALSGVAAKRTAEFFARWLQDPELVNPQHRMPLFELGLNARLDLTAYLSTLGAEQSRNDTRASGDVEMGAGLIQKHRCGACHTLPASLTMPIAKTPLDAGSNWDAGCLDHADASEYVPGYGLSAEERKALKAYISTTSQLQQPLDSLSGPELLAENNCLACHSRDSHIGIESALPQVASQFPDLASRLAALNPPSLTGIGDKLHAKALASVIDGKSTPLRPWLDIRMPKFALSDVELSRMVEDFIEQDRIPANAPGVMAGGSGDSHASASGGVDSDTSALAEQAAQFAAARLVTAEGFGCQSCHKIGDNEPPQVDLKARGTDLTMLGDRIRPTWFQRWVRNPARIVPRMEMPAIKTAAQGLLGNSLDRQLDALWQTLNTPGFQPPKPNPVSVVRAHNQPDHHELPRVLTDVIEMGDQIYLRPLIVGLPNRHNVLIDLESGALAKWWIGDTAYQQTRGKTWYWELGNSPIFDASALESYSLVSADGKVWLPEIDGQTAARFQRLVEDEFVGWSGTLNFGNAGASRKLQITQTIRTGPAGNGFSCYTRFSGLQADDQLMLQTLGDFQRVEVNSMLSKISASLQSLGQLDLTGRFNHLSSQLAGQISVLAEEGSDGSERSWTSVYTSLIAADQFPVAPPLAPGVEPIVLDVVPGFDTIQYPLPATEMPISFAWSPSGDFFVGSLRGKVLQALDTTGDGMFDSYEELAANFPTPFGLQATDAYLDVLTKFGLLRLEGRQPGRSLPRTNQARAKQNGVSANPAGPDNASQAAVVGGGAATSQIASDLDTPSGRFKYARVLSDDWGYTHDYHDWAVGLEKDAEGNYYMALPCQQDDRSEAAAHRRGTAFKLLPYTAASGEIQFKVEPISAGLRFPMGIALSGEGELFTSDNQGNYNPFNELNHLRQGKRYGFINKLENKDGFSPPFESPAINLPHPWTRSVNGICFLETPKELLEAGGAKLFGPLEGHLIGCEMNERALVRMSLQRVGDTFQGAAYPFSRAPAGDSPTFEGPIVCEIAPDGALMVGSLQDSGWGGGQNTGSIVRLQANGELPAGIAEIRATAHGFEIDFTQPIDMQLASDPDNYSIRSYRRISTPAYGGEDQDQRTERASIVRVSADGRQVELSLGGWREGFVYEFNLQNLIGDAAEFFPSQAHYTLRAIPE